MSTVTRKTEIDPIDGTPEKRLYLSIISDYDLRTGLCELVDNALDLWMLDKKASLKISINLDVERQLITVSDDAGGLRQKDLRLLVAPGGSRNEPNAELIGIFGVGGKRAGIALGEHVVIKTRFQKERSFEIDIDKTWLESANWELAAYEIPDIAPGTTEVDISHLRQPFTEDSVGDIRNHLGETYDWFIREGCVIELNGTSVFPHIFETWAFPPGFAPKSVIFEADLGHTGKLSVDITAGLIRDRNEEGDNYGVYFYCNHRLIVKEMKTREVGYFVTSEAGVPHFDASLCRVVVRLQGGAQLMPWNSSKSGINVSHPAFQQIRPMLIRLVSHYSSLSRRFSDDWDGKVLRHTAGEIETIDSAEVATGKRLVLPPLPKSRPRYGEVISQANSSVASRKPWTKGLYEGVIAADLISKQRLEQKNRIALIVLDSTLEIAFKEYLVNESGAAYSDARLLTIFGNRSTVHSEIRRYVRISRDTWKKIDHFYRLRCKLVHERVTVGINDDQLQDFRDVVEAILKKLYKLTFADA